jgi:hypothetical protein
MVGKAQTLHGVRSGLYGRCSNGVPPIHFLHTEHRIQFRSHPMQFLGFSNEKGTLEARNFEVINGLQHVFKKWVEHVRSTSFVKGGSLKKETITTPPQSSNLE